jgi:chorismate mutase
MVEVYMVRGIRGAVRVDTNSKEAIFDSTSTLLKEVLGRNDVVIEDIASIFVTATPDLNADFPAYAIRGNGLRLVPVLCAVELAVPGAMDRVVRMLVNVNTSKGQDEIRHVYLGDTAGLRPDLVEE